MNCVRMKYGENELLFLMDTGASISVIFSKFLQNNDSINTSRKIIINGIGGSSKSLGSVNLSLNLEDNEFKHEFLVMNDFGCGVNGIIGSDFFIKKNATNNFEKFSFSFLE